MKPLSTLTLRNEETGAVEEYEIQDEQARKTLGEKANQSSVNELTEKMYKKAEQSTVDDLDKRITDMVNSDKSSSIKVEGTKLVIRV